MTALTAAALYGRPWPPLPTVGPHTHGPLITARQVPHPPLSGRPPRKDHP